MENIIKKAIEGGYNGVSHQNQKGRWTGARVLSLDDMAWVVLDPLFWQALGKACGWNDENKFRMMGGVAHKINMETGKYIPIWIYHAIKFHEINLTQGWDKAVEYLEDLIK